MVGFFITFHSSESLSELLACWNLGWNKSIAQVLSWTFFPSQLKDSLCLFPRMFFLFFFFFSLESHLFLLGWLRKTDPSGASLFWKKFILFSDLIDKLDVALDSKQEIIFPQIFLYYHPTFLKILSHCFLEDKVAVKKSNIILICNSVWDSFGNLEDYRISLS